MKKIICTVTNDLNYDQRMIRICSTLADAGYDVTLVGRKKPDSRALKKQNFHQKRMKLYFLKGKAFYLEYNIRLFFYLLFHRFDMVSSVDLDSILPGVLVGKLKGKKVAYDAHEYFAELPEVVNRKAVQSIWQKVANFCIPKVDFAYTVCSSLADIFKKDFKKEFGVVRNVPFKKNTPEDQRIPLDEKNTVILYQGALNDGRGIEQMIAAMEYLEDVELRLIGEGDLSDDLRAMVAEKHLSHKVKFLGYVLPDDLPKHTRAAHIGINLLENKGLNYYYSLANKAFDYIQAGKPSLHMDFPEYRKLNEQFDVFLLLQSLDPKEIAAAIQKLKDDKNLYKKLSENCRKAAGTLHWENEAKTLISMYEQHLPVQ
ncbi:MAG: glycosyltransferase [Saprospiraceae bacterium]